VTVTVTSDPSSAPSRAASPMYPRSKPCSSRLWHALRPVSSVLNVATTTLLLSAICFLHYQKELTSPDVPLKHGCGSARWAREGGEGKGRGRWGCVASQPGAYHLYYAKVDSAESRRVGRRVLGKNPHPTSQRARRCSVDLPLARGRWAALRAVRRGFGTKPPR